MRTCETFHPQELTIQCNHLVNSASCYRYLNDAEPCLSESNVPLCVCECVYVCNFVGAFSSSVLISIADDLRANIICVPPLWH